MKAAPITSRPSGASSTTTPPATQQPFTSTIMATYHAQQARRVSRLAAAFMRVLLAAALGVAGAALLVMWATPCDGAQLCALAVITRTTRSPRQWLQAAARRWRAWWLWYRIRSAEYDLAMIEMDLLHLPLQRDLTTQTIDAWTKQLNDCTAQQQQQPQQPQPQRQP